MAEGEEQGDRVDRHVRGVLPDHDLEVGRGQRQQQLVGPVQALLGPCSHRQRRHEEDQQVREVLVERV